MTSSLDLIRGRQVVQTLTNQSGGAIIAGDVVIVSTANDESFTTTTSAAYNSTRVGVAQESIAAAATGRILLEGYAPLVNVSASATRGHYLLTHTVAKQATSQAGYAAGAFGQILKAGTTPSAMIFPVAQVGSAGVARSGSTTDNHLAVWNGSNADSIKDGGAAVSADGWIADANTWTYSSADAPTFVISVNADMTGVLSPGMRIKLTQTTAKYFVVMVVGNFGGGATLITVDGGTDYTLANAAITSPYYSTAKAPLGFPLDVTKWRLVVSDTSDQTQASPSAATWYNIGTISIAIPLGLRLVYYSVLLDARRSSNGACGQDVTLSTANNSESNTAFTSTLYDSNTMIVQQFVHREVYLTLVSKTTYYLNSQGQTGMASIDFRGDKTPTLVVAQNPYI